MRPWELRDALKETPVLGCLAALVGSLKKKPSPRMTFCIESPYGLECLGSGVCGGSAPFAPGEACNGTVRQYPDALHRASYYVFPSRPSSIRQTRAQMGHAPMDSVLSPSLVNLAVGGSGTGNNYCDGRYKSDFLFVNNKR